MVASFSTSLPRALSALAETIAVIDTQHERRKDRSRSHKPVPPPLGVPLSTALDSANRPLRTSYKKFCPECSFVRLRPSCLEVRPSRVLSHRKTLGRCPLYQSTSKAPQW
jgi:hypothetical protein